MSVITTVLSLLEEHGSALLDEPLRLESFLKDLHPQEEREVFLICQAHFAGFVDMLRQETYTTESQKQSIALELVAQCGVAIVYASWVIDAWIQILPQWSYRKNNRKYSGTLDEVLGNTGGR